MSKVNSFWVLFTLIMLATDLINGIIVLLERDADSLAREGRPLSQGADLHAMEAVRGPMYRRFADVTVSNDAAVGDTINDILAKL